MNSIFNRLSFPIKLMIIGLIPLIFLVYVSFQVYSGRQEKIKVIETFLSELKEKTAITSLIDQLQTERMYAFSESLNNTDEGKLFPELEKTDALIQEAEAVSTNRLANFRTYSILHQLPEFRQQISSKKVNADEVLVFYTNIILRLNTLSIISTENILSLQNLNKDIRGQRLLSQMITYLGILRSHYYQSILTGNLTNRSQSQFRQDLNFYNALETELIQKSSQETVNAYKALKKSTNLDDILATIKNIELEKAIAKSEADDWWNLSIVAANQLKTLQREVLVNVGTAAEEIFTEQNDSKNMNIVFLVICILLVVIIISYTISNISKVLNELRLVSEQIAVGKTGNTFSVHNNDVIGKLGRAILLIDESNVEMSKAAVQIGNGNFAVEIAPRSDSDELGNAVVKMKDDLQSYTAANEQKMWMQEALSAINECTRGEKNMLALTGDTLSEVVKYTGSLTGLFYISENLSLTYTSGYAVTNESKIPKNIKFGESLIGQAAMSRQVIYVDDVPDEFVKILSGTGSMVPKYIIIIPLVHNNLVEGVVELGSLNPFSERAKEFISLFAPGLSVSLQSSKSRMKLKELLEETQVQSEELQTQHNELETLNSELQLQSQKLQASEEELRVQQEELQQTNEELEERGGLLEEKNLEVRKKAEELEQTSKYKSEFLANVSHELRTPLNSIILLSRLLHDNNDKNLNEEQIEFAKVIQSSGNGLLGLIDEILDLSKIEAGKMQLEFTKVVVKDITRDMDSLFKTVAREKGIDLNIVMEASLAPIIETDKLSLEQILKNLISNALKFTSEGSVSLVVKSHKIDNSVDFVVADTGIGIAKEKQHLVFEAFQQADGSTKRKYGGTGLGLSISRELAKLLGGNITLTSEPGKGSVFTLNVPITHIIQINEEILEINAPAEEIKNKFISTVIPENIPDDRNNVNINDKVILIIDDDTNFAKSLLDFTRKKGYKGIVAVRGDEGISLATLYKPLGILLDLQLPVKSGWEVIEELKANPQTRNIPVHMMSSHHVRKESLLKGAADFIDKPIALEQMQEIFDKIEIVLNRKSKKVLIIEENPKHAKALAYFLETFNINADLKGNISEGVATLQEKLVDCVILDMGIPLAEDFKVLEEVKNSPGLENVAIIFFTGKSLSKAEEVRIKKYADSIIVKTAHSYQRVLDEISLFLHLVEPKQKNGNNGHIKKLGALNEVLNNRTVLIVDDDVRNIFSLSKALETYKINVITAVDGKEALQRMHENSEIDLVLLDMMMPEMDGYETAKRIRQNTHWRDLPVIALTAKAMSGDRDKCIQAGASDYITKPVDIDQLISLLRVWLYEKLPKIILKPGLQ